MLITLSASLLFIVMLTSLRKLLSNMRLQVFTLLDNLESTKSAPLLFSSVYWNYSYLVYIIKEYRSILNGSWYTEIPTKSSRSFSNFAFTSFLVKNIDRRICCTMALDTSVSHKHKSWNLQTSFIPNSASFRLSISAFRYCRQTLWVTLKISV